MDKQGVDNYIRDVIGVIKLIINEKKILPGLILIYSIIDTLAWLNRPASQDDVTVSDFMSWCDLYLLPGRSLACSSLDLYAARCGILHSLQASSRLSRQGQAKQLWYAWGIGDCNRLMAMIQNAKLSQTAVAVQVEELLEALEQGACKFLATVDINLPSGKQILDRANKFFTNISPKLT